MGHLPAPGFDNQVSISVVLEFETCLIIFVAVSRSEAHVLRDPLTGEFHLPIHLKSSCKQRNPIIVIFDDVSE